MLFIHLLARQPLITLERRLISIIFCKDVEMSRLLSSQNFQELLRLLREEAHHIVLLLINIYKVNDFNSCLLVWLTRKVWLCNIVRPSIKKKKGTCCLLLMWHSCKTQRNCKLVKVWGPYRWNQIYCRCCRHGCPVKIEMMSCWNNTDKRREIRLGCHEECWVEVSFLSKVTEDKGYYALYSPSVE